MSQTNTIGDILVATGRLSQSDAVRIIERQNKDHSKFGEAALALNILTKDDIDYALSKQFDYSYLSDTDDTVSHELVAAYKPFSRVGENLRAIRSQLMLRWFNNDPSHKVITVVSSENGEGRSFIAANLAIVFAQQGQRTLLIDADMRANSERAQHTLFKLGKTAGLSSILSNRAGIDIARLIPGLPGLAVLPAGPTPPNPQELLGRPVFGELLRLASHQFDVVIIDTPASNDFSDAEITAARTGAALLVTRKNKSTIGKIQKLIQRLQEGGVTLVGSVLNDN